MANGLPLLKTGTSSFRKIRAEHRLYVDKTMYIPELINKGDVIFLSRPRRFGKSLTVSTLDSFFTGEKDLFRGLAAEKFMKSQEFVPKPVINLVMSRPSGSDSKEKLENGILTELRLNAKRYGVSLRGSDPADAFLELIREIKEVCSKNAVLLIDEYDAPVIKIVQNPGLSKIKDLLEDTRTVMSNFYSKIKDEDANLDFVFITGVTKFSRMGVFSTLNNIKDISLLPEFAALAGFTQEELENNFKPFIGRTADALDLGENVLLDKIRDYYDGFSFDGETRLYNPFSTMNFFGDMEFNNYWMESGSNTLLREMLRDKGLTVDQFKDLPVDKNFARSPGEIEKTPAHGFLYQAGYLTLRKKTDSSYALDYPNFEVLSSMSRLFIDNLF
ncbi:MAG: AAA family ATPase, partial [Deltaproteobacteria bacterium]|nr:AAA family ATPase [Deltaproteobacteria bacterium]